MALANLVHVIDDDEAIAIRFHSFLGPSASKSAPMNREQSS